MNLQQSLKIFGNTDIYVIDQILKKRYLPGQKILDAGCGNARNLRWFYNCGFDITGVDNDEERLQLARIAYPKSSANFIKADLSNLSFGNAEFDHIICCAVLHFAEDEEHFKKMFSELVRVLKPGGSLLVRTASTIGFEGKEINLKDSVSNQKAGFFISREQIYDLKDSFRLEFLEPVKTTNVEDRRAMTSLVFKK
ncbi:class I SAM-dependent methyltransferase [Gramella sp. BOM4]|nr:class I SAM-dependent methyltransferase [Christiangramia bathymodioli]